MAEPAEAQSPGDLPDQLDDALRAFWRGDTRALQHLVNPDGAGPRVGALFQGIGTSGRVPVIGLPSQSEVAGYRILRVIGRGGMGVVYEAEQQGTRRRVALKVLGLVTTREYRRRFAREIATHAPLRHPCIPTVHQAGQTEDGRQFFVMELVAGVPLDVFVKTHDLPLRDRLELVVKICDGVAYAHGKDVIHRDLKPANILVDAAGDPHILDFGLARSVGPDATGTITGEAGKVMGTLAYMSPEQASGQTAEVGPASDVYSLGVILYELLTGQRPLQPESPQVICEKSPPRPSTIRSGLHCDLEKIVLKALEKEPARRYLSVAELGADVQRYLDGEPVHAQRTSCFYVLRKKLVKHRRTITVGGTVLILGLVAYSAGLWWRVRRLERERAAAVAVACGDVLAAMENIFSGDVGCGYGQAYRVCQQYPEIPDAQLARLQGMFRSPGGSLRHNAIRALEGQVQQDPTGWEYAALLSEMCRAAGNPAQAEKLAAIVSRHMPDTARAWYLRSFAALDAKSALAYARQAVAHAGADVLAWRWFVFLCWKAGDAEGALRGADALIRMDRDPNRWRIQRADALAHLGRLGEAIAVYDGVIAAHDCYEANAHMQRGHALRKSGDCAGAVEDYSATVALLAHDEPNGGLSVKLPNMRRLWAQYHRATARWMCGQIDGAIEDFRQVHPALGRSFYGDARLFVLLRDEGRVLEAADVLAHAIAETPADADWLRAIFDCLAGKIEPQALMAQALQKPDPQRQCEAYYYAGEALRLRGENAAARTCFEKCVGTGVAYDRNQPTQPMNEYDLAAWRLRQPALR